MAKYILEGVNYGRDLNAKIKGCENFYYWEVVSSEIAVRHNIANIPTEAQWLAAEEYAVRILQPLRNIIGAIRMSSWFRCKKLNTLVGSTDGSFHVTGGGGDIEPLDCPLMECLEEAYKLTFSEIIAEFFPNGWVHVAHLKGDNRRILKLKDTTHHFTRVTIDALQKLYPNKKVA